MSREKYEARGKEFWTRYYKQLQGATIIEFVGMNLSDDDRESGIHSAFPCFKVKLANGNYALIEVSQDEEGNGGGVLFGLAFPKMDDYDRKHKLNNYAEATV